VEDITVMSILGVVVTAIISFLIGKSGILTRLYDTRIRKIESDHRKESNMISGAITENKNLREKVNELTLKVSQLEAEIESYRQSQKLIIEYLKKLNIDDPFFNKIMK
jgi:uncharacterized protein YlxW (UPF0749 family)